VQPKPAATDRAPNADLTLGILGRTALVQDGRLKMRVVASRFALV
jgi:hypothetical protein